MMTQGFLLLAIAAVVHSMEEEGVPMDPPMDPPMEETPSESCETECRSNCTAMVMQSGGTCSEKECFRDDCSHEIVAFNFTEVDFDMFPWTTVANRVELQLRKNYNPVKVEFMDACLTTTEGQKLSCNSGSVSGDCSGQTCTIVVELRVFSPEVGSVSFKPIIEAMDLCYSSCDDQCKWFTQTDGKCTEETCSEGQCPSKSFSTPFPWVDVVSYNWDAFAERMTKELAGSNVTGVFVEKVCEVNTTSGVEDNCRLFPRTAVAIMPKRSAQPTADDACTAETCQLVVYLSLSGADIKTADVSAMEATLKQATDIAFPVAPTAAPLTAAPLTAAPLTAAPTTAAPITAAPDTAVPETAAPDTDAPDVTPSEPASALQPSAAVAVLLLLLIALII